MLDRHGIELADAAETVKEAARRIRDVHAVDAEQATPPNTAMIIINDECGSLLELPFEANI